MTGHATNVDLPQTQVSRRLGLRTKQSVPDNVQTWRRVNRFSTSNDPEEVRTTDRPT